jgi:hypothetical protein
MISISSIHREYVPIHDRWHGRLLPRIESWFRHIGEITVLWLLGSKPYTKHGATNETSRQHALVELGDWLWLTAEIIYMTTKLELPIVPEKTLQRIRSKMEENRRPVHAYQNGFTNFHKSR